MSEEKDVEGVMYSIEYMIDNFVDKLVETEQKARKARLAKVASATARMRRKVELGNVCPRCGLAGTAAIENRYGRSYVYYYHYINGERVKCYAGPADGYAVVQQLLGHLGLTNLDDVSFGEIVMRAALRYLNHVARVFEEDDEDEKPEAKKLERELRRRELAREITNTVAAVVKIFATACNEMDDEHKAICRQAVQQSIHEAFQ